MPLCDGLDPRYNSYVHSINAPYQYILSTDLINTPYQPITLSTHPINTPYQHTLSTSPNTTSICNFHEFYL